MNADLNLSPDDIIHLVTNGVNISRTMSQDAEWTNVSWTFSKASDDDGSEGSADDDLVYLQAIKRLQE